MVTVAARLTLPARSWAKIVKVWVEPERSPLTVAVAPVPAYARWPNAGEVATAVPG